MSRESSQKVNSELFSLEPTALLEFFIIHYNYVERPDDKLYIHGGTNGINGSIYWQGVEYLPFPIQSSEFETKGDGSLPRPKLAVSNQDFFISNLIRRYNNLVGAKVVRKRTFVKFLDNINFAEGKNPYGSADPNAGLEDQVFFILRRESENRAMVEFELASPLEIENVTFPRRTVMARYCSFHYRGNGCRYMGPPVADDNDRPLSLPTDFTQGLLIRRHYTGAGSSNPNDTSGLTSIIASSSFSSEALIDTTTIPDGDGTATEFVGYFKVDYGQGGQYSFGLDMDDSADFFVKGQLVAHNYQGGAMNANESPPILNPKGFSSSMTLGEGYHRIVIRHHESAGSQGLIAYYKVPNSTSWTVIPSSRFSYDLTEFRSLGSGQRFFTTLSITKSTALDNSTVQGETFQGRWENNKAYKTGDYVYIDNQNVKVSKRDCNASPNWQPLSVFYFCIKNHSSSMSRFPTLSKEHWVADQCSRTLKGCRLRFGRSGYLPFGGFPGTEEYPISM
jgi:lambda family phage minor tail protein L